MYYPNPTFQANEQDRRYYAVIDGVKSFTLPQLSEHEGKTESLYRGDLKDKMDTNAPFLAQLTVTDDETSPFVQLLFTQAEQPWMGAWDCNPAIFIRSRQSFEAVSYHLRKFIHLYSEQNEKWYFFRFYDPVILVAYLRYIARSPSKLASFFGVRDGQAVIDAFAARIGNRFYTFSLSELPQDTQPSAVGFDEFMEGFLEHFNLNQLVDYLSTQVFPQAFPETVVTTDKIRTWVINLYKLGFNDEGSLELMTKAEYYLQHHHIQIEQLISKVQAEYGDISKVELAKLVYLNAKEIGSD